MTPVRTWSQSLVPAIRGLAWRYAGGFGLRARTTAHRVPRHARRDAGAAACPGPTRLTVSKHHSPGWGPRAGRGAGACARGGWGRVGELVRARGGGAVPIG